MSLTLSTAPQAVRWPSARALGREAAGILAFTALTALAGMVRVPLPFTPVPLTFQLIPVLLSGAALGAGRAAASQLLLLLLGAAGLPVFAGSGPGPAHLLGATGGYLIGFVGASWFVGRLTRGPVRLGIAGTALVMIAGSALVHVFGLVHLAIVLGGSPRLAFELGTLPFLLADLLKAAAATCVVAAWPRGGAPGEGSGT